MRHQTLRLAVAFFTICALALPFQNCSKGFNAGKTGLSSLGSGAANDPTPFAFDMTFDQIAYNSCFGTSTAGHQGYFTISAGSYAESGGVSSSGVRLTSSYLNYVRTSGVVKPIYPAKTITDLQIKQHLISTASNDSARPQMAIRTRGNPQQVRTPNSDKPAEGTNYFTLLGKLTDDRWMDPLVKGNGAFTNFFNLAPGAQRNLEATLTYNKDEGLAQGMRNDLRSSGMLALTYQVPSDVGDATAARAVVDTTTNQTTNNVFGKGYNLSFEIAVAPYTRRYAYAATGSTNASPNGLNPNNILTNVVESDLSRPGQASGTWTCDESRRYMVVRPTEAATYCPLDPYSYMIYGIPSIGMSAATYRQELEIARRSLKAEYWDVSIENRCAVPKEGSCYQNEVINGQQTAIEYDQRQPCYQSLPDIPYGTTLPLKRCAQYVSICVRD